MVITDIEFKAASQTLDRVKARSGKAHAVRHNARITADAKEVVQPTVKAIGRFAILVSNRGIHPFSASTLH